MADTQIIDSPWNPADLEQVRRCPFCDASGRTLAHRSVKDWSFYCAPGSWDYWDCDACHAIYLDPRPTTTSIGKAYGVYYTHATRPLGLVSSLKSRLRNEVLSLRFGVNLEPRLHLPRIAGVLLGPVQARVAAPFGLEQLAKLPKGDFMDVGCGAGDALEIALRTGWRAMGLEIDPLAAKAAEERGLKVIRGGYDVLDQYADSFDLVYCNHVLEHVHDPRGLLSKMKTSLRVGGALLISLPNADSAFRAYFQDDWRGLEAPRHLAIPTERGLVALLESMGFKVLSLKEPRRSCAAESFRIRRRGLSVSRDDLLRASRLGASLRAGDGSNDFTELFCTQ